MLILQIRLFSRHILGAIILRDFLSQGPSKMASSVTRVVSRGQTYPSYARGGEKRSGHARLNTRAILYHIELDLLPLMHWYELQDLLFLIKCLQNQPDNINIYDHVKFVNSGTRRSNHTLQYNYTRITAARHFFFNHVVRL